MSAAPNITPQQREAIKHVQRWLTTPNGKQVFRLHGFAGTGKTTIARRATAGVRAHFCAPTGKAALRLQQKGCDGAATIHKSIYKYVPEPTAAERRVYKSTGQWPSTVAWTREIDMQGLAASASLVVADEASMVDDGLAKDLLRVAPRVLAIGDPAQLPPVQGTGALLLGAADYELTEIHRQAEGNGILAAAAHVRSGKPIGAGLCFGDAVEFDYKNEVSNEALLRAEQVIVGTNHRRMSLNARMRAALGRRTDYPEPGDRLIITRNDSRGAIPVFNGEQGIVIKASEPSPGGGMIRITLDMGDKGRVEVRVHKSHFTEHAPQHRNGEHSATFAYAITCHKAQGSEWARVLVYDESRLFGRDDAGGFDPCKAKQWLYTAITRATEHLTLAV